MQTRWIVIVLMLLAVLASGALLLMEPPQQQTTNTPLTSLTPDTLNRISVVTTKTDSSGSEITLQLQQRRGRWFVTHPVEIEANPIQVKKLISIIQLRSHNQFELQADKLSQYGLDQPKMEFHLNNEKLLIGENDPIRKRRYVFYRQRVHLVTDTTALWMDKSPQVFVSPALLNPQTKLSRIEWPGIKLHRIDTGWQLVSTSKNSKISDASQDDLNALVDEWRYAQALNINLLDKSSLATTPHIKLFLQGTSEPIVFLINPDHNSLVRPDLGIEYQLAAKTFELLTQHLTQ